MAKKQKDQAERKPVLTELAAGVSDTNWGGDTGSLLQPPDPFNTGDTLKTYQTLLSDDKIKTAFGQRRAGVVSAEWEVLPGGDAPIDQEAADFIREQLRGIQFDRKTDMMLAGIFYGYAVGECLWAIEENKIVLADIKVRKRQRFRFNKDGKLCLLTKDKPDGEEMPDRKFWTFNAGADDDDSSYGQGLGYWLYWPVFFKKNGAKFWGIYTEKYAMPSAKATYPVQATKDEIKKALAAAGALRTESAIALPEGFDVMLVEAIRSSEGSYEKFLGYWDDAIVGIILGQTGTTKIGPHVGTANAHMDVKKEAVKADADVVCSSLNNSVVAWLTDWNFPGARPPKVWRDLTEPEDLNARADRDKKLHDMGFDLDEAAVVQVYGEGYSRREVAPPPPPVVQDTGKSSAQFAEAPPDALEAFIGGLFAEGDLDAPMEAMLGPLEKLVGGCANFEELKDRLAEGLDTMETDGLADVLAKGLFNARLAGRGDGLDGTG